MVVFGDNNKTHCTQYLWRIGSQGLYAGYPHEMHRLWSDLPKNFTHVDAVYENKDRQIVFFIGKGAAANERNIS